MEKMLSRDEDVAALLREGLNPYAASKALGVSIVVAQRVQRCIEAGLPLGMHGHALRNLERDTAVVAAAKVRDQAAVAKEFGLSRNAVRHILRRAEIRAGTYVKVERVSSPAPIKRPRKKAKQPDPLFLTCSRKHPITRSNTVQGTEKECLICRKRGVNVSPALVYARERLIAELERQVAIEVAELTADLRPEMEKAA